MPTPQAVALVGVRACSLAAVVALLSACHTPGKQDRLYVLEIEARNRHLEEQFRTGNLLGVADVYADDGVLLDARGERTAGREELDAYWSAIESPVDWRLDIETIRGSDALAYEVGTSHLSTRREGEVTTAVNHFLVLWRREPGGEWRITLDAYWPLPPR
ncbi:MAG: nuclear transport factor 2 family protein [Planctomycetes bacterium]|nr:nuclear transport factor 2 family protein [Planctomycetota bacterium]